MRLAVPVLAVLLAAASCATKPEEDRVLAEVAGPLHAAILLREVQVPVPCEGNALARLRCHLEGGKTFTRVWLKLGDAPAPAGYDVPGRVLAQDEPSAGVQLSEDESGTRLAWRTGTTQPWVFFYVLDGEIVDPPVDPWRGGGRQIQTPSQHWGERPRPLPVVTDPVDWARVPTLAERAEELALNAREELLPRWFALIRKERGEAALGTALARTLFRFEDASWVAAFASLGPEGRSAFQQHLRVALVGPPLREVLVWFLAGHPEYAPADLSDLLAHAVETRSDEPAPLERFDAAADYLGALHQRGDARAGRLACAWLSAMVARGELKAPGDLQPLSPLLAAIVHQGVRCAAATAALQQRPCDVLLRCPGPDDDPDADDRGGWPLCDARQCRERVEVPGLPSIDTEVGPALLTAARANGPLPDEVVRHNARRLYRLEDSSRGDAGVLDDWPCKYDVDRAPEAACAIGLSATRVKLKTCDLTVDDGRQVLRLTPRP